MELVKLRMKKSYRVFLSIIGILILFSGVILGIYHFSPSFAFNNADIEANGNISINYLENKNFDNTNNKVKFSITNNSNQDISYSIILNKVVGEATYKLICEDNIINEKTIKNADEIEIYEGILNNKDTIYYTLEINSEKDINGIIKVKENEDKKVVFKDLILENNNVLDGSKTKVGIEPATEDEGLIKDSDDLGTTYYFRGNVTNNYVLLNDLTFRIVRINGDGTVKLVLDGETESVSSYYTDIQKVSLEEATINTYLKNWLEVNLEDKLDYISTYKFCNDISHDGAYNYNAAIRIETNSIPTFNCLANEVSSNIGLLTIDEVLYAGASLNGDNKDYYLYNENINNNWYTLSATKGSDIYLNMYMVTPHGKVDKDTTADLNRGVRPVINLVKNIEMQGTGTKSDPYKIIK